MLENEAIDLLLCVQSTLRSRFHTAKTYIYNYYYGHVWLPLPFIRSMDSTILCNKSTCVCLRLRLRTARARVCLSVCVCVYISVVFINNANAVLITSHGCLLPTYTYTMILDFLFSSNGFNDYIIYVCVIGCERADRTFVVGIFLLMLDFKTVIYS